MPRISQARVGTNVCAYLDMLAYSEIGASMLKLTDDGYNVLVGSTPTKLLLFDSYARHPDIYNKKMNSTAAGRYQFIHRTWLGLVEKLHLTDITPVSQDLGCIELIRGRGALEDVQAGRITDAIHKCAKEWASLPGAGYSQHENELANLIQAYVDAGGGV